MNTFAPSRWSPDAARGHNKLRSGKETGAAGFRVEDSARPKSHLIAEFVGYLFESMDRSGDGHRDLDRADAAFIYGIDRGERVLIG